MAFACVKLIQHLVSVDDALSRFSFLHSRSWVGHWDLIYVLETEVLKGNLVEMLFEAIYRVLLCYPIDRIVELFAAVLDPISSDRFLDQLNVRCEI